MNVRAYPEQKFLLKYVLIGIGCLIFAALSIKDGFYSYPKKIPRSAAYKQLKEKIESDPKLTDADIKPMWTEIAEKNGWDPKLLTKKEDVATIKSNIIYQYVFIVLGLGIGVPCLLLYFRNYKSWIESTENGLRSSRGQELEISQIRQLDKAKWEKKGISVLHYQTNQGENAKFVIDDLKYNRKATDEILRWVESQIPVEMIVNGFPEEIPEEESDDSSHDQAQQTETADRA